LLFLILSMKAVATSRPLLTRSRVSVSSSTKSVVTGVPCFPEAIMGRNFLAFS